MQSISSRIWTRVAVSISCDNNDYTTGTYIIYVFIVTGVLQGMVDCILLHINPFGYLKPILVYMYIYKK